VANSSGNNPEPDVEPVNDNIAPLNYESPPKSSRSEQPYRTASAIPHGLLYLSFGSMLIAGSVSDIRAFLRSGRSVFELSIALVIAFLGVAVVAYSLFVFWMYRRALSGRRTYSAPRSLGRVVRWLTSFIDG
jgi:hypothetical protein